MWQSNVFILVAFFFFFFCSESHSHFLHIVSHQICVLHSVLSHFFYGHRKITQNDVLTRDTTVVVKMCLLLFMLSDSYEILSLFCCLFGARSMTFDVKCVHSTHKYVANSFYWRREKKRRKLKTAALSHYAANNMWVCATRLLNKL